MNLPRDPPRPPRPDDQAVENELQAAPAVLHASIQIVRKATGKVENWDLTFTPTPDNDEAR